MRNNICLRRDKLNEDFIYLQAICLGQGAICIDIVFYSYLKDRGGENHYIFRALNGSCILICDIFTDDLIKDSSFKYNFPVSILFSEVL